MAAAAKIGCLNCGETVAVNINRSGRAYYHCGHCHMTVTSKGEESTEALIKRGRKNVEVDEVDKPVQQNDAPKQARKQAVPASAQGTKAKPQSTVQDTKSNKPAPQVSDTAAPKKFTLLG